MKQYISQITEERINVMRHAYEKLDEDLRVLHPTVYERSLEFFIGKTCNIAQMVNAWIHFSIKDENFVALQHICRYYDLDPIAVRAGAKDLAERSKVMTADEIVDVITTKHSNIQTGKPQGDIGSGLDATLKQRGKTHGDYTDHARITQELKATVDHELDLRSQRGQPPLEATARESIDMILHKIGRIIAGQWDEKDHWQDIAGYATITEQRIQK